VCLIIALPRNGRLTNLSEEAAANTLVLAASEIRSKKSSNDSCIRSFIMEISVRDIVERPESVLVLPVGQKGTVLLIEEYDLGAETWQLTIPEGKVTDPTSDDILKRAEIELRE
jgi:hypothetical protein